jgi:hypothetical protein
MLIIYYKPFYNAKKYILKIYNYNIITKLLLIFGNH